MCYILATVIAVAAAHTELMMTFFLGDRGFLWKASVATAFPLTLVVLFHGIVGVTQPLLITILRLSPENSLWWVIFPSLTLVTGTLVLATWTLIGYVVLSVLLFVVKQVRGRSGTAELGLSSRCYSESRSSKPETLKTPSQSSSGV